MRITNAKQAGTSRTPRPRSRHAEAGILYRATVIDTISRERLGTFCFSNDCIEDARPRAWGIAGSLFGNGIGVRVEQISK